MMRTSLAVFLLLLPAVVAAQQEDQLPDLTPREFEIRGELQVSLPDLQRQPLRGFAPPPRTYVVPADRRAHVAPYGQDLDQLPDRGLAPGPAPSLMRAEPRTGQIDLLVGRHYARIGRLTVNAGGLGVDVGYNGYTGFDPFTAPGATQPSPDYTSDSDNLAGKVSFTTGDALQVNVSGHGRYHEYALLGARENPDQDQRQLRALGVTASVRGAEMQPQFTLEAGFQTSAAADPLGSADASFVLERQDESMFFGGGSITQGVLQVHGRVSTVSLQADLAPGTIAPFGFEIDWLNASVLTYESGTSYNLELDIGELSVGVGVVGFNPSESNRARMWTFLNPPEGDWGGLTVGPVADFRMSIGAATQFFARTEPSAEPRSQIDIYRTNPYAQISPAVAPDVHLLDAVFGVEVQTQVIRFDAFGGARLSPNQLYFERGGLGIGLETPLLYLARYDAASTYRVGANLTGYAPGDISISAGVEYRIARLTDQDRDIPYVAPLAGRVSVAAPFALGRGLLQASLRAEGTRPTESEDVDAPAWADLSVEAHYRLAGRFGLLVRADRLAGRAEQWPGFPHPPATITAGVRAGW